MQSAERLVLKVLLSLTALTAVACGPSERNNGNGSGTVDAQPPDAPCSTALTGKVFAPNGTLPLHNVRVYVPLTNPQPFPAGVQCQKCSSGLDGGAVVSTTTGPDGSFRLDGIPVVDNLPVIITTGKWRRRLTVPFIGQCVDNIVQDGMFRLPRNRSEGELPKIAMVTGGCDPLGCILSKLGIDDSEFGSASTGPQSVIFYNGSGGSAPGTPQPADALWSNLEEMKKFDMVINSCECSENNGNKTSPDLLRQYADIGGRVFGSHFHYTWTKNLIPQWLSTATWANNGSTSTPDLVDTTHPTGMAFAQWLVSVGASASLGQISLSDKIRNATDVGPGTTRWLYSSGTPATTHYLSFTTPVGAAQGEACGKVVYAGMHVASGSVNSTFPSGCSSGLTADEKALAFLLFDLGACVDIIL